MSKRSDGIGRGRLDRAKIEGAAESSIRQQAAAELETLGLAKTLSQPYSVYNSPIPDLKRLRDQLRCSQSEFAERFGLSLRTVQQWEQGRARPDQPARVLLTTIEVEPDAVARAASLAIQRVLEPNTTGSKSGRFLLLVQSLDPGAVEPPASSLSRFRLPSMRPGRRDPNESKKFVA